MINTRIISTSVKAYQKRHHPKKHYVFLVEVSWSDGKTSTVRRSHEEFFIFQCRLVDRFSDRTLPVFPGRKLIGRTNTRGVAEKRLPLLEAYLREVLALDDAVSQCDLVRKFLSPTAADFSASELKKQASCDDAPSRDDEGSDGDDAAENYLSAVVATCDYVPTENDFEGVDAQLSLKTGETLYVVNVVDCPNGFWQARNSAGEVGLIPCKHVTIDPDDMKKRMSMRAVRRLSLSGSTAPKPRNKVLRRSYVSTECLAVPGSFTRLRPSLKAARRHSCIVDGDEIVAMSDYQMTASSDDNSEPQSHLSTPIAPRKAEVDIPDIVKSSQSTQVTSENVYDVKKTPSQVLKSDIMNLFRGLDRPSSTDDLPTKLTSFASELALNTTAMTSTTESPAVRLRRSSGNPRRKLMRKSMTESLLDCRSIDSAYSSDEKMSRGSSRAIDSLGLIHEKKVFVSVSDEGDEVEGEAYKAVEKYKPIDRTGLPIVKGDMLVVTLKLDDGWWCGRSCSSGLSGWFPSWVAKRVGDL